MSMHHHRMECECEECFRSWSAAQDGPNKIGAFSVALKRIAALEAELKQAYDIIEVRESEIKTTSDALIQSIDSLARVTKERDEILAMLREVTFRGNFAPNDYELELRACETIRMLDPEKGGGA